MSKMGTGPKNTFFGRLLITGNEPIVNVDTIVNKINCPNLNFLITPDGLLDFVENTGIFTFKRRGLLDIQGVLNITTTTGNTEVEITPEYNDGTGWSFLNARTAELPVIAAQQAVIVGAIAEIKKGDMLRFLFRSPNSSASFKTDALPNTAVIPAAVVHFILSIK
ncbi:MAG: hypothetical protein KAI64_04730 [Thermoplasmata archaeon]|nr:hypothetical protein [Thermoplasmata archaeon]